MLLLSTSSPPLAGTTLGSPVIIIPGDGASALEVKFQMSKVKHFYCHKSSGGKWQRLWVPDLTNLLPGKEDDEECQALHQQKDNGIPTAGLGPRISGITGETIIDLKPPNLDQVRAQLQEFVGGAGICRERCCCRAPCESALSGYG